MTTTPLKYMPQLDGLRAFAVIVVLFFHLELAGFDGGYLGVSVFFTLSGYLITRLLLDEISETGRIDYFRYMARRMRRLLPAATIGLAGIAIGLVNGLFGPNENARAGVVAAAAQVYNWFELFTGVSYADLFRAPSPVAHFWSLSIEEQFYWLWPLVLFVAIRFAARRQRPLRSTLAWAVAISLGVTVAAAVVTAVWGSASAVYLATWSRAPEILIGGMLAVAAHRGTTWPQLKYLQVPLFLAICLAVVFTPSGHGWAYRGGLPAFALLSAVFIASLQEAGVMTAAFSLRPVVHIGRMSYGLYVYHWPLFLILTPTRLGFEGPGLVAVRLVVTYLAALISMIAIEVPVRLHKFRITPRWQVTTGATLTLLILGLTTMLLPASTAPAAAPTVITSKHNADPVAPAATVPGGVSGAAAAPVSVPLEVPTTTLPPTTTIAFFGDSVGAWMLRDAASTFDRADVTILNGTIEGCEGYAVDTQTRSRDGGVLPVLDDCSPWTETFPGLVAAAPSPPRAAVLMVGQTASLDHNINGQWQGPCDDLTWYVGDLGSRIDWLQARGIAVTLALPAHPGKKARFIQPDDYWNRFDCVRSAMLTLGQAKNVMIIDLDKVLCYGGDCETTRSDGVHLDAQYAPIALNYILDQVLAQFGVTPAPAPPPTTPSSPVESTTTLGAASTGPASTTTTVPLTNQTTTVPLPSPATTAAPPPAVATTVATTLPATTPPTTTQAPVATTQAPTTTHPPATAPPPPPPPPEGSTP